MAAGVADTAAAVEAAATATEASYNLVLPRGALFAPLIFCSSRSEGIPVS